MRTGLIAAITRTDTGALRAELPLAGRSVLAWQVDLLRMFGVERIVCLCEGAAGEVLRLQHEVEASGASFHALKGFAALPALVRAEDELIILRDGLVPDAALVCALAGTGGGLNRLVAAIPSDHPLTSSHPEDFERIDAGRHWAGLLVMRGAPVQQLADFPADADAISVLLRLALQAGTPCRMLKPEDLAADTWLLADSSRAVAVHEQALIANAASTTDWRAPMVGLAATAVRMLAPRGMAQGALVASGTGLALLVAGMVLAALGFPGAGLALAALGAFSGRVAEAYAKLSARLRRQMDDGQRGRAMALAVDGSAAIVLWFALGPWPQWTPLAICGPLVVGLERLAEQTQGSALAAISSDRTTMLMLLGLAAGLGVLPEAVAFVAAALLTGLLLRKAAN